MVFLQIIRTRQLENKIIHRGVFSLTMEEYYFTISDKNYEKFDVFMSKKVNNTWSEPEHAFFNSEYSEHGMSFSPNGKSLFFSSTRPIKNTEIPQTWHIWKTEKKNGQWTEPEFVDIPNLRNKLVSHPTVANSGTLYFHVANLDYSAMDIYYAKQVNNKFENAEKIKLSENVEIKKCTPYISPNEDFLIFAAIENQLELMICFNNHSGEWIKTKKLGAEINTNGQGNPYISPDNQFLFFASGKHQGNWTIKWVRFKP